MNCKKMDVYAHKYEAGELNSIQKIKFEKHINECEDCKKKYRTLLLLGALWYSSDKTAIQNSSPSIWLFIKQATAAIAAVAVITTTVLFVGDVSNEQKDKAKLINSKTAVEKSVITTDKSKKNGGNIEIKNKKSIKIISRENEKEIEINLNIENLKMETRKER